MRPFGAPSTRSENSVNGCRQSACICGVPYDPAVPVWTGWDLGIRDPTVVVCAQIVGREIHVIDYYLDHPMRTLTHFFAWLDSRKYPVCDPSLAT